MDRLLVERWRLTVDGSGVRRPLKLSYDDLLGLPSVTTTKFIECAGNGRSFFGTWAQWSILWPATPGSYVLKARATDTRGNVQPVATTFNDLGYLFSAIVEHPVTVA